METEALVNTLELPHNEIEQVEQDLQTSPPPQRSETPIERVAAPQVESLPATFSGLTFSCVLIPRFDDHYLSGDITDDLPKWMREICISYGWRIDAITIRPGYMHWVMTVPFDSNPAHFMRLARRQTSERIFENYPRFSRKNVSNDFWAPGFSVAAGSQIHTVDEIDNFIAQTRRQQGIF